jgi:hypothetical protein
MSAPATPDTTRSDVANRPATRFFTTPMLPAPLTSAEEDQRSRRSARVGAMQTWKMLLCAPLLTALAGCSDSIPEEYAALGIPPNPERVEKIIKQDNPGNTVYMIEYKVSFDADAYVATNSKILAAGYTVNERGDTFTGPKGSFELSCGGNNDRCRLQIPKK